jgi:hypothetical protein
MAVTLPVTATLKVEFATLAPITFTGSGSVVANGSGPGGHLASLAVPAGLVGGAATLVVTDPAAAPIRGFQVSVANAAGAAAETAGGKLSGSIGLPGYLKTCLFGTGGCAGATANLTVPLTPVGAGGFGFETGAVNLTVFGAPWTTGTVAIGATSLPGLTRMGFAQGPASAPSSTAQPGGVVQLVTPIFVRTNTCCNDPVPAFATLTLHFVPEPTTLVLLGTGAAALAMAGRRRAQP